MAPIEELGNDDGRNAGYICGLVGAIVISVGLILFVIQCGCCRRSKQPDGQVSSLGYDFKDSDVLPPPSPDDNDEQVEVEINLEEPSRGDQSQTSTTLKAIQPMLKRSKSRGQYRRMEMERDVSRTAKETGDSDSRTAVSRETTVPRPTRLVWMDLKSEKTDTNDKTEAPQDPDLMISAERTDTGVTAHGLSRFPQYYHDEQKVNVERLRSVANTTAPSNVKMKGWILSARGSRVSTKNPWDLGNENGLFNRQMNEKRKNENTSVSFRVEAASPLSKSKSPMVSESMRVNGGSNDEK